MSGLCGMGVFTNVNQAVWPLFPSQTCGVMKASGAACAPEANRQRIQQMCCDYANLNTLHPVISNLHDPIHLNWTDTTFSDDHALYSERNTEAQLRDSAQRHTLYRAYGGGANIIGMPDTTQLNLLRVTFDSCSSDDTSGGLLINGGQVEIESSRFSNCSARGEAGAFFFGVPNPISPEDDMNDSDRLAASNPHLNGYGIQGGSRLVVRHTTFERSQAVSMGGCVRIQGGVSRIAALSRARAQLGVSEGQAFKTLAVELRTHSLRDVNFTNCQLVATPETSIQADSTGGALAMFTRGAYPISHFRANDMARVEAVNVNFVNNTVIKRIK